MMSFPRRVFALFFLFTIFLHPLQAAAKDESGKVVILFDHSISDSKYNPRVLSKVWLETFLKSFNKSYDITLAGFDDIITEYFRTVVATNQDRELAKAKTREIANSGFTADFETPLAYLLDRQENEHLLFAVVITNGKPEIWNKKNKTLSRRIKFDFRYDDINEKLNAMEAEQISYNDIYGKLNSEYQNRNIELIEKKLVVFTQELAGKIIFIDLSDGRGQLREWAKIAGTHYTNIKGSIDIPPIERVSNLIYSTQELAAKELGGKLPDDYKEIADKVIKEEAELSSLRILSLPKALPIQEGEGKIRIKVSRSVTGTRLVSIIFSLALLPFIAMFLLRRKDDDENNELDIEFDDKGTLESLENEVKVMEIPSLPSINPLPPLNPKEQELHEEPQAKYEPEPIAEPVKKDKKFEPVQKLEFQPSDINLTLRVLAPAGIMQAYWRNDNGNIVTGSVLSVSLDRVHFEAKGYNGSLQRVKSEKFNAEFRVTASHTENSSISEAVVVIDSFDDDATTRMSWIGLLSDIEDINY